MILPVKTIHNEFGRLEKIKISIEAVVMQVASIIVYNNIRSCNIKNECYKNTSISKKSNIMKFINYIIINKKITQLYTIVLYVLHAG